MNAFKKKAGVSEPNSSIDQLNSKLNLLLGLGSSECPPERKKGVLNRQLILSCAMFWDSKERIDKIKSLALKDQKLNEFNDTEDFQVSELMSIELLSLSKNNIIHLQPLSVLDTLVCLNINNNKVYDISPLAELTKLQELYASNNQIVYIDALKSLNQLRIINLYNNKINRLDETVCILQSLKSLEQLDIQENPIYNQGTRKRFLVFQKLARLNGELILEDQRQDLGIMTSSVVILPTAKFRDTHTSFFNQNKSQVKTSITGLSQRQSQTKFKSKLQLNGIIQSLEQEYFAIDDQFQQEIVKNVQLKSEFHKCSEEKKILERKNQQAKEKEQQLTQLKRKVKMLKQNLFNNAQAPRKGQLLRELFELEMMSQNKKDQIVQKLPKEKNNLWVRKFDYDEEIIITTKSDDKYLFDEDQQLALLLSQNNSALQQIKKELREMNK